MTMWRSPSISASSSARSAPYWLREARRHPRQHYLPLSWNGQPRAEHALILSASLRSRNPVFGRLVPPSFRARQHHLAQAACFATRLQALRADLALPQRLGSEVCDTAGLTSPAGPASVDLAL